MKYAFSCPSPCNYTINVEAQSDEEAIGKIVAAGKVHAKEAHPDMPPMTEQEMKQMVRTGMRKS
jgi:predicted small metal-binding protein